MSSQALPATVIAFQRAPPTRCNALPAIVAIFLLEHALQGWCPPLPVFRRRGVRTAREIEEERHALKAAWDIGFLVVGALLVVAGYALARSDTQRADVSLRRAA